MSSSVELKAVPSREIEFVWLAVAPILSKAVGRSRGRDSLSSVLQALMDRRSQLWLAVDHKIRGVIVTEINTYPTGLKALNYQFVAGEGVDDWIHVSRHIEFWGRQHGCSLAEARGRKGWLRKWNWTEAGVEMIKEL